jgi:hypothetical protein
MIQRKIYSTHKREEEITIAGPKRKDEKMI